MLPLHHDPVLGRAYAFQSHQHLFAPRAWFASVVALRIELSATWLSAAFGPPALGYRNLSRDGRTRTCVLVLPGDAGQALPYIPSFPVRTAGFEPAISYTPSRRDTQASLRSATSGSCGSRTRLFGVKGRCPQPIDERAAFRA